MVVNLVKTDRQKAIIRFIRSCTVPPSTMEVATAFGFSERTARRVLADMANSHLVMRIDGWVLATQTN